MNHQWPENVSYELAGEIRDKVAIENNKDFIFYVYDHDEEIDFHRELSDEINEELLTSCIYQNEEFFGAVRILKDQGVIISQEVLQRAYILFNAYIHHSHSRSKISLKILKEILSEIDSPFCRRIIKSYSKKYYDIHENISKYYARNQETSTNSFQDYKMYKAAKIITKCIRYKIERKRAAIKIQKWFKEILYSPDIFLKTSTGKKSKENFENSR